MNFFSCCCYCFSFSSAYWNRISRYKSRHWLGILSEFLSSHSRFFSSLGLNVITEFIAGVAIPGDPLANVTFKTYGYITQAQALTLISDLKLGHYMKVVYNLYFCPISSVKYFKSG